MLEPVLRRAVRSVNAEHEARAATQLVLGVVFTFVMFGMIFVIVLLGVGMSAWFMGRARMVAGGITLVLLAGAFWSAWRRVDPLQGLGEMSPTNPAASIAVFAATGIPIAHPRQSAAGAASLLIAGPLNIMEAAASWGSRLRIDGPLYYAGADLLGRAAQGVDLEFIDDPRPFVLLRRLRLVKVEERPEGLGRVVLTQKGREAMSEAGMVTL